jgi:hypothetical protein
LRTVAIAGATTRFAPGGDSLNVQRGTFHGDAATEDRLAGRGNRETLGRSIQQLHAQAPLEKGNAPSNGHMTDAEHARGAGETAGMRYGQKETDIVPLPSCRDPVHS